MRWGLIFFTFLLCASLVNASLFGSDDYIILPGKVTNTFVNSTILNVTNNITQNITLTINTTSYINITNNVTNNYSITNNLTQNITFNQTTFINLTNNITNNITTIIGGTNITNNITQNITIINNITNNYTMNYTDLNNSLTSKIDSNSTYFITHPIDKNYTWLNYTWNYPNYTFYNYTWLNYTFDGYKANDTVLLGLIQANSTMFTNGITNIVSNLTSLNSSLTGKIDSNSTWFITNPQDKNYTWLNYTWLNYTWPSPINYATNDTNLLTIIQQNNTDVLGHVDANSTQFIADNTSQANLISVLRLDNTSQANLLVSLNTSLTAKIDANSTALIALIGAVNGSANSQSTAGGWTNTSTNTTTMLNVGIGTTTPTHPLDIQGLVMNTPTLSLNTVLVNSSGSEQSEYQSLMFNNYAPAGITDEIRSYANAWVDANSGLAFLTHNSWGTFERVRIDHGGNVGIGTSTPLAAFHNTGSTILGTSANLVTNGDFASDTAWTKGAEWVISGGVAEHTGTTWSVMSQTTLIPVPGRTYRVEFDVVSGGASFYVYLSDLYQANSGTGHKVWTVTATDMGNLFFGTDTPTVIDNVVVTEIGNVGIGTTSPGEKLSVSGNLSTTGNMYSAGSQVCTAGNGLCAQSLGSAAGWSNTSTATSTSLNVGVGIVSPSANLQVQGVNTNLLVNGSNQAVLTLNAPLASRAALVEFKQGSTTYWDAGILYDEAGNSKYSIGTSSALADAKLTVQSDGNVGIGTTSPANPLSVNGTVEIRSGGVLKVRPSGNDYDWQIGSSAYDFAIWDGGYLSNPRLFIQQATGNVGIGTVSPLYVLDVNGTVNAWVFLQNGTDIYAATKTGITNIVSNLTALNTSLTAVIQSNNTDVIGRINAINVTASANYQTNITALNTSLAAKIDANSTQFIADNASQANLISVLRLDNTSQANQISSLNTSLTGKIDSNSTTFTTNVTNLLSLIGLNSTQFMADNTSQASLISVLLKNGSTASLNKTNIMGGLQVQDSTVYFNGTIGNLSLSGAGTRLMWTPANASFRAGYITGTQWDATNMGQGSFASGYSTQASGESSTAMGTSTIANGTASFAVGSTASAYGVTSAAIGNSLGSRGISSMAFGDSNNANGDYSTAMGRWMNVWGNYSFGIGLTYNGAGYTLSQSNAMSIMGGRVGIGTLAPNQDFEVVGTGNFSGSVLVNGMNITNTISVVNNSVLKNGSSANLTSLSITQGLNITGAFNWTFNYGGLANITIRCNQWSSSTGYCMSGENATCNFYLGKTVNATGGQSAAILC